jgi:hypothetical protein
MNITINNISYPVLKWEITHLIWDFRNKKIKIRVEYHTTNKKVFQKDFEFPETTEVNVNELLDKVKKLHDGKI